MKKLLLSTAFLSAVGGFAVAQDTGNMFRAESDAMNLRASEFIGMRIYASEASIDADEYDGMQEGWNDIGEINDVILSRDGKIDAVQYGGYPFRQRRIHRRFSERFLCRDDCRSGGY
jgi:hypothetical protein